MDQFDCTLPDDVARYLETQKEEIVGKVLMALLTARNFRSEIKKIKTRRGDY